MTDPLVELARVAAAEYWQESGDGFEQFSARCILSGEWDEMAYTQAALSALRTQQAMIVEWFLDPERCPFGKNPMFYADAIKQGAYLKGRG